MKKQPYGGAAGSTHFLDFTGALLSVSTFEVVVFTQVTALWIATPRLKTIGVLPDVVSIYGAKERIIHKERDVTCCSTVFILPVLLIQNPKQTTCCFFR